MTTVELLTYTLELLEREFNEWFTDYDTQNYCVVYNNKEYYIFKEDLDYFLELKKRLEGE